MSAGNGHIAIAGGGVIGLAIAWRLAEAGVCVDLFDPAPVGKAASWAAGGMLAAGVEHESADAGFYAFARASQELWPGFAGALEAASGVDVHLDCEGTLVAVYDDGAAANWRALQERRAAGGVSLSWLDAEAARALEPGLAPGLLGALFSPLDGQVDNRRLATALFAACKGAGVRLHERQGIDRILIERNRVVGIAVRGEMIRTDRLVLAAGAWSGAIEGLSDESRPPVRPLKGQMVALRAADPAQLPRHVVWGPGLYCVPRRDGRLLLGATSEEAGFDTGLTAGGIGGLLSAAAALFPATAGFGFEEVWAGLRPATPDGLPILGETAIQGLFMATGHHRNGILLLPITTAVLADLLLMRDGPRDLDLKPFDPARFSGSNRIAGDRGLRARQ